MSFEKRIKSSQEIMKIYPNRIPIIVEKHKNSNINNIDKKKYLAPKDLTMGQFSYVIRKRIKLSEEQAIFIFINNKILAPTNALMQTIYYYYKNEDGFLYITYSGENTFG